MSVKSASRTKSALFCAALLLLAGAAGADEGMWTFDNFPAAEVKKKYGVDITPAWLEKTRLSTVRLANCTASFISPDGLILTNHHCAASCLAQISTAQQDRVRGGFVAKDRAEEVRCPTQYADVLMEIENITAKVDAATRGQDDKTANETRKKTLTGLEQACEQAAAKAKSGPLKCESVRLYQGGQHFLHKYRRYAEVRIAFAPEAAIAAFGGDPDNFQFPRWCLDMAILRAYENGKPARTPTHYKVNWSGPAAGEFVMVAGHPGSTDRLLTVPQLKELRDLQLPTTLLRAAELRGRYIQYAKTGAEARRIVDDPLNSLENTMKVRRKQLDALHEDALLQDKTRQEQALRQALAGNAAAQREAGDPWADIEKAVATERAIYLPYVFIESAAGFNSALFRYARTLVRGTAEREKGNTERLREYTDTSLPLVEQQLQAAVPVYPEREKLTLSFGFERMREWLGPDHPLVRRILKQESPDTLAEQLVGGSRLADPAVRRALWEGGSAAVKASDDAMIKLALAVDEDARAVRKRYEDEVEAPVETASGKIARARFAALGTSVYPDATFTLRLNYGTVQGWNENGRPVDPVTRLETLFQRATGQAPFAVPESWQRRRAQLDAATPFNLATNNDIVGGNSGSPLIDAKGDIVGLLFDGNIHSISGSYWFDAQKNRAIAVHPAIMRTALTRVYEATALTKELGIQ